MKLVRLPRMDQNEIEALISEQGICRIAFRGEEYPCIAPFQYVYKNGPLYFHFTNYGRKMRLLGKNNKVCVAIERLEKDMSDYRFLALRGGLEIVEDPSERAETIREMAEMGSRRYSEKFLAAHGFEEGKGWQALTADKPIVIVKLKDITESIGLKSPD